MSARKNEMPRKQARVDGPELNPSVSVKPKSIWNVWVMAMRSRAKWTPVIVSNRDVPSEGHTRAGQAGDTVAGPAFLNLAYVDGLLEDMTKDLDQKYQRRADLRFATGVAIALALPAFIALGVYVAAESIRLIAS
jgi:hypothetical protein